MPITRRNLIVGTGAAAATVQTAPRLGRAQTAGTIRIGVMNDQSGLYSHIGGVNGVAMAQAAANEFNARGFTVEVLRADHQNRPDVGSNIARQWFDRDGVDMILDVPTSSVGLAVAGVAREKDKAYINVGAASSDLTGAQCAPTTVHWVYDTYMLAKSTGGAMVRAGGDTWFFITADYAFGHALERDTTNFVRAAGGKVQGGVRTPFPGTSDFSSFLVQAQASRAKVVGLANAGQDTTNCIKQAAEFGLTRRGTKLAALLMFVDDVHGLGLQTAQGLVMTESFYWDLNDRTRALTQRVRSRLTGNQVPNMVTAGNYSAVLHYLKVVSDMGVQASKVSGTAVVNRMKAMPCDDDAFGPGTIRADGRRLMPAFLFEVKKPEESRGAWDYLKLLQTTPAEEAWRPINEGGCPLVRS
ncbi:MAG: ABC transporter, substrate-binding protein (cluster 4, leucine/isoleucine/valine/benzoate) [uncultured Acetobacteraceae bacterium]|uniref:ABC transporter, substrate-binding protein (Cluster 4, leucine/isoleucine/valine/benzoate) n=1 Tax=uncultured Acetobacteraceae bacterium TaxID=169975 RepID=A0A6J4H0A9_9PROT|nr:MAG: ABC transporter, substrate-binding protein (cluster 4, leucine/isoleucine/valine/benzoate) [uncultured Acetobacteraceae bacterium]